MLKKKRRTTVISYILLILISLFSIVPFYYVISIALKNPLDAFSTQYKVFFIPTLVSVIASIAGNNGEYKHCLKDISLEQIAQAHIEFENDLVERAEEAGDE